MILKGDCFDLIKDIDSKSVDLILVDPPYLISRSSNFKNYSDDASQELITKYGKVSIDFGEWDKGELDWDLLFKEYYRILKDSGTLIIFYDVWKSSDIKSMADKYKFKQPRVGQWQKTNPVPINSKLNYLSNAIEFFFTFVKGKKPTFHSVYDNGVYKYPICHGKERYDHPTQKPLALISDIINKHSNEGDVVLDNFAGTGTTAHACILNNRNYIVIERDDKYFDILKSRIKGLTTNLESNDIK
jgi:site-specific DNA-methyltransferase (adenine-specific)